jgi:hypothetical protein
MTACSTWSWNRLLKSLRRFQHASGRPDGQSEVDSMIEPGLGYTWRR